MTSSDRPVGAGPAQGGSAEPAYLAVLDLLRCPQCRGTFLTPGGPEAATSEELVCSDCGRAYPVRGGIPVLLVDEARLPASDVEGDAGSGPDGARG